MTHDQPEINPQKVRKSVNVYLKYSGLAFQMAGMVAAGIFLGQWLDKKFHTPKPFFTLVLVCVFFGGFMYKLYIDLTKKPDEGEGTEK